ncbi:hypothetical protein EDC96DRAFT_323904 [Choanephora cucurbitarum]|nr:hypothetical protein EDC96DRAFT_323904 [Choanephora cucurbitarum]
MQNSNSPVVLALHQPDNGSSSLNHYYQLVLQPGSPWPETIFNNHQYCSEANFASWQSLYEPQLPNKTNKCTEYVGIDTRLGTTNSTQPLQPTQPTQKIAMYAGIDTRHGKKQPTFKIPKRKEFEKVTLPPCKYDSVIEDYTDINPQCDFCGSDFEERPFKYLKSKQKHLSNAALAYCKVHAMHDLQKKLKEMNHPVDLLEKISLENIDDRITRCLKLIEQDDENGLANLMYNSYENFMSRIKEEGFVHTYRHLVIASKRSTYLVFLVSLITNCRTLNFFFSQDTMEMMGQA